MVVLRTTMAKLYADLHYFRFIQTFLLFSWSAYSISFVVRRITMAVLTIHYIHVKKETVSRYTLVLAKHYTMRYHLKPFKMSDSFVNVQLDETMRSQGTVVSAQILSQTNCPAKNIFNASTILAYIKNKP